MGKYVTVLASAITEFKQHLHDSAGVEKDINLFPKCNVVLKRGLPLQSNHFLSKSEVRTSEA